ncbi:hypothetical protein GQ457_12G013830 [Hibiscus cannabinus]
MGSFLDKFKVTNHVLRIVKNFQKVYHSEEYEIDPLLVGLELGNLDIGIIQFEGIQLSLYLFPFVYFLVCLIFFHFRLSTCFTLKLILHNQVSKDDLEKERGLLWTMEEYR